MASIARHPFLCPKRHPGLHEVTPEIIRWDHAIANTSQFNIELEKAHDDLVDIRSDYMLPRSCNN